MLTIIEEWGFGVRDEELALHQRDMLELGGKRFLHADGIDKVGHTNKIKDHLGVLLSAS